ncbi:SLC13 family permease [Paenibacillus sp. YN15]|uniref:SLC13 family permease n=1 Tax=Paenibacillus sp. YN15 TaxID=1742774 RepID=UPI001C657098|nr:SLC13 family permease [Paenibacillus sp. YN15]
MMKTDIPLFNLRTPARLWPAVKQEAVLATAFVCAVLTMFFVPPSPAYVGYMDFRVLALLFCLMVVVAGVQSCGLFDVLAQKLLSGSKSIRLLCLLLILMPFAGSMLITNDVALLAFVPFAIVVLDMIGRPQYLILVITAQTLAANLGSMATPIGNPQNLFLYSKYHISIASFLTAMLPYTLLSLLALALMVFLFKKEAIEVRFDTPRTISNPRQVYLMSGLFLLCLLSVLHVIHYGVVLALVLAAMLLFARDLFRKADYSLLATFVFFFICAGNIGQMEQLRHFLSSIMAKSTLVSSVLASQLISNVPAAVLLSGFTDRWKELLIGVNVGGLGTLIASLASLISFKLYLKTPKARPLKYLGVFTAANAAGLLVLMLAAGLWNH